MRVGRAFVALLSLAMGCAHAPRPHSFNVEAPPTATYVAAQNALREQGHVVIPDSPTRLVTPWQEVGRGTVVTSTRSGVLEPIIIWRRYTILVQQDGAGTTVTVSEEIETCPPDAPKVIPGTSISPCVHQPMISPEEQQGLDRLGSDLQRRLLRLP